MEYSKFRWFVVNYCDFRCLEGVLLILGVLVWN